MSSPLEQQRRRDISLAGRFDHALPATPAVVGQLVTDRRRLTRDVAELQKVLREVAKIVPPFFTQTHTRINEALEL